VRDEIKKGGIEDLYDQKKKLEDILEQMKGYDPSLSQGI